MNKIVLYCIVFNSSKSKGVLVVPSANNFLAVINHMTFIAQVTGSINLFEGVDMKQKAFSRYNIDRLVSESCHNSVTNYLYLSHTLLLTSYESTPFLVIH